MQAKYFLALATVGLATSALAGGCSSDPDETGTGGTGGTTPTTTTTIDTGTTTTSDSGSTTTNTNTDDGNDSCADAVDYASEADGEGLVYGAIQVEGDADYVMIDMTAGDYFMLDASAPDMPDYSDPSYVYEEWLDTVVSLYDETGATLLATVDDGYPRYNTDSRLVIRAPADGTYCIKIEDWGSWAGTVRPVQANADWAFGVYVPAETAGNVIDLESNNDASEAQVMTFADLTDTDSKLAWVYGGLDAQTDVDVYEFTMTANTGAISLQDLIPRFGAGDAGTNGNGSTLELGLINVTNAAGTEILSQLDASRGADSIFSPLTAGETYLIWVQRKAATTAGTNDFYDLILQLTATDSLNQSETEVNVGDNDVFGSAETPTIADPQALNPQYFITGNIGASDTDMWTIPAMVGDEIALSCSAARSGSGLTGADFAIVGSDGTTSLQHETETEDGDVFWYTDPQIDSSMDGVAITTAGNYYLSVSATGQKANVTGSYYLCGVTVVKP